MLPIILAAIVVALLLGAAAVGLWASRRKAVESIDLTELKASVSEESTTPDDEPVGESHVETPTNNVVELNDGVVEAEGHGNSDELVYTVVQVDLGEDSHLDETESAESDVIDIDQAQQDEDDEPALSVVALSVDRPTSDVIVMEITGPEPDGTFHSVPHHHH